MSDSVCQGAKVTLHFSLSLEDGQQVDSNYDADPATFTVGDGNLLPGFEQSLIGLAAGAKERFAVAPENGFGQPDPNNIQQVSRASFGADADLQKGLVMTFLDANKMEVPGVITAFDDDTVTVDFNHPLAGRTILFDVHILSVTAP
ncbi:MAG: FKBP-type peptidyl-prolyl cis-trans isomerase [Porticoccaceae bacterium]|nr:FKBP-type peptidyl-prolyl cis-trans isomerase [Porticoccaceae bacterium]